MQFSDILETTVIHDKLLVITDTPPLHLREQVFCSLILG